MDGKDNGNGNDGVRKVQKGKTVQKEKGEEKMTFLVDKWVDDRDLEAVLNKRDGEGYEAVQMFRNSGTVETTTIVWREVVTAFEKMLMQTIPRGFGYYYTETSEG